MSEYFQSMQTKHTWDLHRFQASGGPPPTILHTQKTEAAAFKGGLVCAFRFAAGLGCSKRCAGPFCCGRGAADAALPIAGEPPPAAILLAGPASPST
jgi:hypothetical protein